MIDKKKALEIARNDASNVYRDLSIYEISATLRDAEWHIDYEIKDSETAGGGPHYVISGETGEIISRRYEQ